LLDGNTLGLELLRTLAHQGARQEKWETRNGKRETRTGILKVSIDKLEVRTEKSLAVPAGDNRPLR
jgi:hypothetical protein